MVASEITGMVSRLQAARIGGVSVERIDQARRAGKLAAVTTPLGHLFPIEAVEAFRKERQEREERRRDGRH